MATRRIRQIRWISVALTCFFYAACGSGSSAGSNSPGSAASLTTSVVQSPVAMDVYPVSSTIEGNRLFVTITGVGNTNVSLPVAFDTGSAGLTLYAPNIFPSNMVTPDGGFVFPAGQTSLTYQGITVTNQQGYRKYGGANGRTQTGNIGYAQVTFGDAHGSLTTDVMPILLYYQVTSTATGAFVAPQVQQGWFGVNTNPGQITVPNSVEPSGGFPACDQNTTGTCYAVSVLKFLHYASSVDAGFILTPIQLQPCDISIAASCMPVSALTVGLTPALETGFNTLSLTCPPVNYTGPSIISNYQVCAAAIPGTLISVSGANTGTLTTQVLFDSGTPEVLLNIPAGTAFPAPFIAGDTVQVTTPSGFVYSYTAGTGVDDSVVTPNSTAVQSVIGIGYFTTNSFFIDFTSGTEGWK
jgi:hypothetical protein